MYAAGLGAFRTIYACYLVLRRKEHVVRGNAWRDALAGALAGIAGGLAGFPGAFVTIWCLMRGWDKLRQRAVYQPYILAMQLVTIACLRWQSPIHDSIAQDLAFVPFALVGAVGGLAVFQRLSQKQFQLVVSLLLAVSGVGLLVPCLKRYRPHISTMSRLMRAASAAERWSSRSSPTVRPRAEVSALAAAQPGEEVLASLDSIQAIP